MKKKIMVVWNGNYREIMNNLFQTYSEFDVEGQKISYYSLTKLEQQGFSGISRLPCSIKILLEGLLRNCDDYLVTREQVNHLAKWQPIIEKSPEIPFMPSRILMQDFTGVPAIVDLAAMRSAIKRLHGNPKKINPLVPVDLVVDHSIQVDQYGSKESLEYNTKKEFERNLERYKFLKWGQKAFRNFRVVPPATGICHQINLEYLANIVQTKNIDGKTTTFPDTLVGTDSHTTMINGLGVLGWGVGGIEAEAVMLGQPTYLLIPQVIGVKLEGCLKEGVTATDLVLTITQMLRKHGVVDKFVEFFGSGLNSLCLADRATIANMAPEYGATIGFFPVDDETLKYLKLTGRAKVIPIVEQYCKNQGLFRENSEPIFSETLLVNLDSIESSIAGPKRPQDRVSVNKVKENFLKMLTSKVEEGGYGIEKIDQNWQNRELNHGSIVIASITSCTNTSNPSVMISAGLLAKKAFEKGLKVPPHIKTSLAPGSKVVSAYLNASGLQKYLDELGFNTVGYGCTTCIGNSGPLKQEISEQIKNNNLVVVSVLSGNRNFEGRVSPETKANYLASPPLVIAYALAGKINIDLATEAIGANSNGQSVYLKDIWPTQQEINKEVDQYITAGLFQKEYADVFKGSTEWNKITINENELYEWEIDSTYIQEPPYFTQFGKEKKSVKDISNARVLVMIGDSVTTDHISPAGAISKNSPAGQYLLEKGIQPEDFNSYGSRRGNHEIMMRGTFANPRIKNLLVHASEGNITLHLPDQKQMSIYSAALLYEKENIPVIIIAGKDYGMGSSRDWAAKGPALLGVKAVIAESYERIHRSNLIGMGILPLQFKQGETPKQLGLTGTELYSIKGLNVDLKVKQTINVQITQNNGAQTEIQTILRLDNKVEIEYYKNGGILPTVLRQLIKE